MIGVYFKMIIYYSEILLRFCSFYSNILKRIQMSQVELIFTEGSKPFSITFVLLKNKLKGHSEHSAPRRGDSWKTDRRWITRIARWSAVPKSSSTNINVCFHFNILHFLSLRMLNRLPPPFAANSMVLLLLHHHDHQFLLNAYTQYTYSIHTLHIHT